MSIKNNLAYIVLLSLAAFWSIYAILYYEFILIHEPNVSGYLAFFGETLADFLIILNTYFLVIRSNDGYKFFFHMLLYSFIAAFIADFSYNVFLNIKQIPITDFFDSIFDIPFIIFLSCECVAWGFLCFKRENHDPIKIFDFLPYAITSVVIFFAFTFLIPWKLSHFSILGLYQIVDTFLESLCFLFCSLVLVRANKLWCKMIGIGFLLIIGSDFVIRYGVVEKKLLSFSVMEPIWVFGLLLFSFGLFLFKNDQEDALLSIQCLKPRIASWVYMIGSVIALGVVMYSRNFMGNIANIFIFILFGSLIISDVVSHIFSKPFLDIKKIVENFNQDDKDFTDIPFTTSIPELKSLVLFLFESLKNKKKILNLKTEFENIAKQVAHDICSPLTSFELIIKHSPELHTEKRKILSDSINQIREIISNLKKSNSSQSDALALIELSYLVNQVVTERQIAFSNHDINIFFSNACPNAYFVKIEPSMMKRILVNVFNNSCEAGFLSKTEINVSLYARDAMVYIEICDNASGVSKEALKSIFSRGFTTKINGSGLGLSHAKEKLIQWGGDIKLIPNVGRGVTVTISIPLQPTN